MSLNICMDCKLEKKRCQCSAEPIVLQEDSMIKKIKEKIKAMWKWYVSWLFNWKR